ETRRRGRRRSPSCHQHIALAISPTRAAKPADLDPGSPVPAPNLTREDAAVRAALLSVDSYDVALDFTDTAGSPTDRTFRSVTTLRFAAGRPGASTFLDLVADAIGTVTLNGERVDASGYEPDRGIVLAALAADNTVVVEAEMAYTNTGEGMHRF